MSDSVRVVKFFDETFKLNDEPSEFALMEFAEVASDGIDGDSMKGMAGMMRLIKECVDEKELPRFLASARKNRAKAADLIPVLQKCYGVSGRPTSLPSDSSDGQPVTEVKSDARFDDRGSDRLSGRPDLQLALVRSKSA